LLPGVESIRGFAHAAGFAAARRCLQFLVFAVFYVLLATNRRYFTRSPVDGFVQNLAPRLDS